MNFTNKRTMTTVLAATLLAFCGAMADDEEPLVLDEQPEQGGTRDEEIIREASEIAETGRSADRKISIASGLTLIGTLNAIAKQMEPEHSIRTDLLSEEELALLSSATNRYSTGDVSKEWSKVLDAVLEPFEIAYYEDGDEIAFGSVEAMEALANKQAINELANNHRKIVVDFSGGVEIGTALRTIRSLAEIKLNFDYMEDAYRNIAPIVDPEATVPESEKDPVKVQAQQQRRQTTFSTDGRKVEWRSVMREVLDPINYKFVEEGGVVRPMPEKEYVDFQKAKVNAKPLVTKIVRVKHADPESLAKQLNDLNITKHSGAYIKVAQPKKDRTKTYSGGAAGMSIPSGTKVGASSVGSGNFGNLDRPSTPPSLLIADVAENIPVIEERIASLDVRERQILIEALILNVDDDTSQALGVQWSGLKELQAFKANWQKSRSDNSERVRISTHRSLDSYEASQYDSTSWTSGSSSSKTRSSDASGSSTSLGTVSRDASTEKVSEAFSGYAYNNGAWGDGTYTLGDNGLASTFGAGVSKVSERISKTLFSGLIGPINLAATLNLVEERGKDQVLSSPVLTMGDHTESIILVGDAHPIAIVRNSYVQDRADMAQEIEWQIVMSGVTLWVAPEITDDGKSVRISVHPQITKVTGWEEYRSELLGEFKYPTIQSRELDTRVTVPDGNTLVLGGLIDNENTVNKGKVWLLGDIPFLGRLFRWENTTEIRKNLMILIRPTILDDEEPETKFDEPSMRTIEPLHEQNTKLLGNREDPVRDRMREGEKAVIRFFKSDKDGGTKEVDGAELGLEDAVEVPAQPDEGAPDADPAPPQGDEPPVVVE